MLADSASLGMHVAWGPRQKRDRRLVYGCERALNPLELAISARGFRGETLKPNTNLHFCFLAPFGRLMIISCR